MPRAWRDRQPTAQLWKATLTGRTTEVQLQLNLGTPILQDRQNKKLWWGGCLRTTRPHPAAPNTLTRGG